MYGSCANFPPCFQGLGLWDGDLEGEGFWCFRQKSKNLREGKQERDVLMMQDVEVDRPMPEIPAYETETAVDGAAGTAEEGPGCARVVGEHWVGVLKERDGDWIYVSQERFSSTYDQISTWNLEAPHQEQQGGTYESSDWSTATVPRKRGKPSRHQSN